jgi:hypothetical protein
MERTGCRPHPEEKRMSQQGNKNRSPSATMEEVRKTVEGADTPDPRTQQLVDAAEKHINALVREAGSKYEEVSAYLVETVFDGDTLSALTPSRSAPMAYTELLRRCDDTLLLPRHKVLQATRIGALNRHLSGTPWKGLSWSAKQELLPLVGADGDLAALKEGARAAAKGLGMRAVRDWVVKKTAGEPPAEEGTEQPTVPNVVASRRAFELAAGFARSQERRAWLLKVDKLPPKERDALFSSLKSASRHLAKLLAEFETSMQEA